MSEQGASLRLVRCAKCVFWSPFNAAVGVCRRRAPRPIVGSDHETVAHWPETFAEEGCGDGQVKSAAGTGLLHCQSCLFWMQGSPDGGLEPINYNEQTRAWWRNAGRCVRRAPEPLANPGARLVWPATHAQDGCGQSAARGAAGPELLQT